MIVLLIPSHQMPPCVAGHEVDARGFLAEAVEWTTETLTLKTREGDESLTVSMDWVAAGVYRWQDKDYAVFRHFNPAEGEQS